VAGRRGPAGHRDAVGAPGDHAERAQRSTAAAAAVSHSQTQNLAAQVSLSFYLKNIKKQQKKTTRNAFVKKKMFSRLFCAWYNLGSFLFNYFFIYIFF